ncbi:redoxin domain-containing protein [Litchfieldia alkalitelluris]|uniref:redoxin domain-containing protein n=1 Tax=Litchfieldia alkalitelluris TaxID=304268 RepID=UPI00099779D0|nr:redoxin domain-containing protein [Litchfieldia alkalitelluris]
MFKRVVVILGLVILAGWGMYDAKNEVRQDEVPVSNTIVEIGVEQGNQAPDFQLDDLDGKSQKLSDLRGKKIILNFWATWCPPCKAEMPHMQSFYDEMGESVEILAVNLFHSERKEGAVKEFAEDYNITFPILLDQTGEVGDEYKAYTIPTSYIIDSNGIIAKKIIGPMDKEMMMEMLKSVK